jgi:hypothetical protein
MFINVHFVEHIHIKSETRESHTNTHTVEGACENKKGIKFVFVSAKFSLIQQPTKGQIELENIYFFPHKTTG